MAHDGCMGRLSWPTAVGLTAVAGLQPSWPTEAAVRHGVWWSKLINFETVLYFCKMN
jgi:hypothetical protein